MNTIYTLSIILITLILNASVTWAMPFMKTKWHAFIARTKRKLNAPKPVDCILLEQRVADLETQYKQRQNNFKQRVREEVIEYLEQLQK
jgi:hypothetical protein